MQKISKFSKNLKMRMRMIQRSRGDVTRPNYRGGTNTNTHTNINTKIQIQIQIGVDENDSEET